MRAKLLVMVSLLSLLPVISASGQEEGKVEANIPFQFVVAGKVLPAGQYTFTPAAELQKSITIHGPDKASALAVVITRIGGRSGAAAEGADVVFDKVGDKYYLSELWIPNEDGFLLHSTKEKHTHQVINGPR